MIAILKKRRIGRGRVLRESFGEHRSHRGLGERARGGGRGGFGDVMGLENEPGGGGAGGEGAAVHGRVHGGDDEFFGEENCE